MKHVYETITGYLVVVEEVDVGFWYYEHDQDEFILREMDPDECNMVYIGEL